MRVALLTREFPPEVYGGAGVHVEYLSRELARLVDLAVHCFGGPRESALVAGSYRPWEELAGPSPGIAALETISVDLAMARRVEGSDLVHSHTWYANLGGHLAKLLWGIPHVVTTHSLEPLRPWKAEQLAGGYAISSLCERLAIEGADAVIAVSEQMRRDVLGAYPSVDPERVVVVHNGIDADEYHPTPDTEALARLGIEPDRPSVVFIGRITRQKGIVHLLDAAAAIDPGAQLVFLAGSPDTPEIAAEVRSRHEHLRASRTGVVWVEQMLPRGDVIQVLSHAAVFVCPSIYEPFGLVNLEAMACSVPVVASAVGGIPEIVVDGETGYTVPCSVAEASGDGGGEAAAASTFSAALAQRINALLADPELRRRMGQAGRRRVLERFSWRAVAERTAEVYRGLAARGPTG